MKCIIGTKKGMTQVFQSNGTVVPVTRVQAGPCAVSQVKTKQHDGVDAVQIGYGTQQKFRQSKAVRGHLKDLPSFRILKEFTTTKADAHLERGTKFSVSTFESGDKVSVTGQSKGKGFQGVVKRHGFAGAQATHGTKDQLRMPGSIGATDAARVFKGTRMGGQMGDDQVTIKNLEIIKVDTENNELLIKGAVPGAKGSFVFVYTHEGTITPDKDEVAESKEEKKEETNVEEKESKQKTTDTDEETNPTSEDDTNEKEA